MLKIFLSLIDKLHYYFKEIELTDYLLRKNIYFLFLLTTLQ